MILAGLVLVQLGCEGPGLLGSVSGPRADPEGAWRARQAWLTRLTGWEVGGRMAVRTADDALTASLHWRQQETGFDIQLGGPLGRGAMRLHGDGSRVVLRTADGKVGVAASAETMLRERTGLEVPISVLRYWVVGLPSPDWPIGGLEIDRSGLLRALRQGAWRLHVTRYGRYGPSGTVVLPEKLKMEGAGMSVRMILKHWRIDGPNPPNAGARRSVRDRG